jgi:hypothetical protein
MASELQTAEYQKSYTELKRNVLFLIHWNNFYLYYRKKYFVLYDTSRITSKLLGNLHYYDVIFV